MANQTDRSTGYGGDLAIKSPCRVATTANITLSGTQTIDGIAVVADDRVLVKNQTTASENGIYDCNANTWTRASDFDGARDIVTGTMVRVISGTENANSIWQISTTGTLTIGTTSLTFTSTAVGGFSGQGIADAIGAATAKTTPVGADQFGILDSVGSLFKRLSFTNLAAWISTSVNAATATTATNVTGSASVTGAIQTSSASVPIGYAAGSGGGVTQSTSKSTGVTLNKTNGQITTHNAALAAGATVSFFVTTSAVDGAGQDLFILNHRSGGTIGGYFFNAQCGAGGFQLYITNNTAGSLSEALVILFAVVKGSYT